MALIAKGTTIGIDTTVTAQTLQDLIGKALVSGISATDINGSAFFYAATTATPSASVYPFWYDTSTLDPVFRVFASPFNIWLTVGPDRFEIPLKNMSGGTTHKGALVCSTGASAFYVATNPSLNTINFLQDTCASGAWGPVCTYGIGWAAFSSSVSTSGTQTAGALRAWGCPAGYCYGLGIDAASTASRPMFGTWLEPMIANPAVTTYRALIWGPKLTT